MMLSTFIESILTEISFYTLILLGYIKQFFSKNEVGKEKYRNDYPALVSSSTIFFKKYVVDRLEDCYSFTICSAPGTEVVIRERRKSNVSGSFQ